MLYYTTGSYYLSARTYCGSEPYTSPEVAQGGRYHRVSQEIWSLGVGRGSHIYFLFALFTGATVCDGVWGISLC